MKSLSVLVVTLFTVVYTHAQNQTGIFIGPQATTARYSVAGQKQKTDIKYGFQAGVNMKVPFEGDLFFAPAAFYSLKGYKASFTQFTFPPDPNAKDNNTTLHTFELAALLQYDFSKSPGHFFLKGGPSLDFQLFGKEKFNLMTGGTVKRSMTFSFADYGHFAANMLAQFGYETAEGLMVFVQYSHGLASISNADFGPRVRHRVFGISVGKYLEKRK